MVADESSVLSRFAGGYWSVPAFLDYVQPALTEEAVAGAEAQLGVVLPAVYLRLLREQNGGYLRARSKLSETMFGIGPRFPSITRDESWWRPKNAEPGMWAPEEPALLIPFDGDGHWDMCFDYRKCGPAGDPSVTYVDCECEYEEPIAGHLLDYLAGLVDDESDRSIRVYGTTTPEVVARGIARCLRRDVPTVGDFDHGYPIWRVALGDAEWCWCSSNRVPKGFRREGLRVVTTEATALRIPEDPSCRVLLSCTEEAKPAVVAALGALRLDRGPTDGTVGPTT
jgi:hypothetical protein